MDRCPRSRRSRGLRKSRKRFRNHLESPFCLRRKAGKQSRTAGRKASSNRRRDCAARNIGTCFPAGQSLWSPATDLQCTDHHRGWTCPATPSRSEEHTSELQSRLHLVCRLLLEKKKKKNSIYRILCKTSHVCDDTCEGLVICA